jgi:hypothetical protein
MTPPVALGVRTAPQLDRFPLPDVHAPSSPVNPPPPAAATDQGLRRFVRPGILLWTLTVIGATIRARGLTSGGLRTSDAWVALTSKVGLGQSWHMLANAPGFYLLEREWLLLHPDVTWWGQLPVLIVGVACVPAIYFLFRYLKFDTWVQLTAASVVSLSPICIIYSTRYKEYGVDFLLACLLLAGAEEVRRHWRPRDIRNLAIVTAVSFVMSASTLPVIVAMWLAVVIHGRTSGRRLKDLLVSIVPAGIILLVVDRVFYGHLSGALTRSWSNNFFSRTSPLAFVDSVGRLTIYLYQGMTGSILNGAIVLVLLTGLAILGTRQGAVTLSSSLVVGAALIACTLRVIPLGTGRTDEVLYPALLVLFGSGLQYLYRSFRTSVSAKRWHPWCIGGIAVSLMTVLLLSGVVTPNGYDNKDVKPLAAEVSRQFRPGDHIVVDAMLRYSWALYDDAPPHIVLGDNWMTGFTVASTKSNTFIVPSFRIEGGWQPRVWTGQLASYKRLWVMEPAYSAHPSLQPSPDSFYADLYRAGWHPVRSIVGTGAEAILLQR